MAKLKTYSVSGNITGGIVKENKLHKEISASGAITSFDGIVVSGDVLEIYGAAIANQVLLDDTILNHIDISLTEYKTTKNNAIDTRTGELISNGYVYAGKTFSLSGNAQTNILALFATKGHPALVYPIQYSTIDDVGTYDVLNATDVENMYLTALGTKRAHLDSGTSLKNQVRAAIDKAGVDAVIDNR